MSAATARTALVVLVDDASDVLGRWRRRYDAAAVQRGIPPHLTILFPLVSASEVGDALLARLRDLYAHVEPFAYDLASVRSFPGVVWLAPEPALPFVELIERTRAAFPDHPPYGDATLEAVPHCTLGVFEDPGEVPSLVDDLRAALADVLPIHCTARAVTLLAERGDARWSTRASFALRGGG